jgi:hypothetical protein
VPFDYTRLRPTELARLLNEETPPGADPIDVRAVRRHQNEAGLQIGSDGRIHLLRYAAWLRSRWKGTTPPTAPIPTEQLRDDYEQIKARAADRNRKASAAGREIGELPAVANARRRARAMRSLETFCRVYLAATFYRPFSRSHKKAARKIELAVARGGCFAFAMPRGFGKSTLAKAACLWAILRGLRRFVCLIGSSATMAERRLKEIKSWCEQSELLAADFPEVFYPIRKMGRIVGRAAGQTYRGQPTRIEWAADRIIFPTIPGSKSSGATISACGLSGSEVRGQSDVKADGATIRPDFVLLDDPQTRESARSVLQSDERENTIFADVMGMADALRGIAVFAAVTVICRGDLSSRLLDRKRHPEFQGERTPMLWQLPRNLALWDEYARIRAESLAADGDGSEATKFYRAHRKEMDEQADPAQREFYWPVEGELSAVEHAMRLRQRDLAAFEAECQNNPLDPAKKHGVELTIEKVTHKITGIPRGVLPVKAQHATAYVDVHDSILYWAAGGFETDFTGYVVDYGTHPEQPVSFFRQSNPPIPLSAAYPGASKEAVIVAGLKTLVDSLFAREFRREDGAIFHVGKMLLDMGYEGDSVKSFCRRSGHGDAILPAKGFYIPPGVDWYSYFAAKQGGRTGYHWRMPPPEDGIRYVLLDADHWAGFVADRLAMPVGDPGGLSLWGDKPRAHEPFAEHICAEDREWRQKGEAGKWHFTAKRGDPDNHWGDCLRGICAGASLSGVSVPGLNGGGQLRRIKLSELQAAKRQA